MKTDEFIQDATECRKVVIDKNYEFYVVREGPGLTKTDPDSCQHVFVDGNEYAVMGHLVEVIFENEGVPKAVRHLWNVNAMQIGIPPEPDGRRTCYRLYCEPLANNGWKAHSALPSDYTDPDDEEEFGSHVVWNPETGLLERSTNIHYDGF